VGVATDHVIESFRNDMLDSYKDGSGVDPMLRAQFGLVEEVLAAAGFTVWPMVEVEADDALAAAAVVAHADPRVERAVICTPDKDLGQCVTADGRLQILAVGPLVPGTLAEVGAEQLVGAVDQVHMHPSSLAQRPPNRGLL
jgi:5'-3' exonuclease